MLIVFHVMYIFNNNELPFVYMYFEIMIITNWMVNFNAKNGWLLWLLHLLAQLFHFAFGHLANFEWEISMQRVERAAKVDKLNFEEISNDYCIHTANFLYSDLHPNTFLVV